MTAQDQDLQRIKAWDRYQEAKRSFLATKAYVQDWERVFSSLREKMRFHLFDLTESDFSRLPTRENIVKGLDDLRAARTELERAQEEAKKWGVPY